MRVDTSGPTGGCGSSVESRVSEVASDGSGVKPSPDEGIVSNEDGTSTRAVTPPTAAAVSSTVTP